MFAALDQIVSARRQSVARAKAGANLAELRRRAEAAAPPGFRGALEAREYAVIAELKKASPSRGLIRGDFDVAALAAGFSRAGAAALSVLTEEEHFQGSLANIELAHQASNLPCLRKDFIVDEFQVVEARAVGASAILLIVAALTDSELQRFHNAARELSIDVLCEVHDAEELRRALDIGFGIIGVNNRNLRTFEVDLEAALRLAQHIPSGVLKVAESGIHTAADLVRLRQAGYDAFLIGESLMRAEDPGQALAQLLQTASATAAAHS
ncbi:MAG: indole-3-glycerol phosphate synthase TrpC [Acidobacteria bacterium]|nr:indole-3-glycerol phosphate synthase TrpC [Acidobacteriota bacterium]